MAWYRNERTGKIDGENISLVFFLAFLIIIVIGAVVWAIHHDYQRSKLHEILHYQTQLEDRLNIEIWRKDGRDLNDSVIIIEEHLIKIKSIGNELEIPIKRKIKSYELKPIYKVFSDIFSSTMTNRIRAYVIEIELGE